MRAFLFIYAVFAISQNAHADSRIKQFIHDKCVEILAGVSSHESTIKPGAKTPTGKIIQSQAGVGKGGYGYQFQDTFELPLEIESSLRKHAIEKLQAQEEPESSGSYIANTAEAYRELPDEVREMIKRANRHVIHDFNDLELSYIAIIIDVTANGIWHADNGKLEFNFLMNFGGPGPKMGKIKMERKGTTFIDPKSKDFATETLGVGQSVLINSKRRAKRDEDFSPGYHIGPALRDIQKAESENPVAHRTGVLLIYHKKGEREPEDSVPTEF